jgi:hypothetical protein
VRQGDPVPALTATAGVDALNPFASGGAIATSYAETAKGGLAQAQAQAGFNIGESQSTAKTTFGGVSVQSTVELIGGGSTEAIAQGGSGQSPANPGQFNGITFSTALPNAAYATTLIGSASNVADTLLGPDDKIFGTAILEGSGGSSTFDFSFRGDLILGVIADSGFDIVVNGTDILSEDVGDNRVINLGSIFGPDIDLTIEGDGVFAFGGAVPEPSTWAMMLGGFAGLSFLGWRGSRKTTAHAAKADFSGIGHLWKSPFASRGQQFILIHSGALFNRKCWNDARPMPRRSSASRHHAAPARRGGRPGPVNRRGLRTDSQDGLPGCRRSYPARFRERWG